MFTQEDYDLINKEFESLRMASLKRCANEEEYKGVIKAFEFANEAHKNVRRRSGEPYILHPIAVAKIVVQEIGLGYKSIVTALLHDIVEDTEYTVEDISRLFGEKIASLVDGLTKIKSAIDSKHNESESTDAGNAEVQEMVAKSMQAENFKRILFTLNDDVRVILIKLADRLHNLRTIDSLPERKKDKILSETMYIFIPLAHRLGLYRIKSEMENIWLKNREPEAFETISQKINEFVDKKGEDVDQLITALTQLIINEGYENPKITRRTKTPYSVWRKMETKKCTFEEVYDLIAIRIIFEPRPNISERKQCWDIYSLVTEGRKTNISRLRDWVSNPKSNGYESLHCTIMSNTGNWIEVQIRSVRMDEIAEKGVAAHWSYKGIRNSESEMDKWLNKVRETLENPDVSALEFLDEFRNELLANEIFVFTPTGESKRLPNGATALDLAYEIHSEIGNKAIAAKINLKLVPLSKTLKNGDQVEIITTESNTPKREWLNFVTTQKSKSAIYEFLKDDVKNAISQGQIQLENELEKIGLKPQTRVLKKIMTAFAVNNKDELYSKIGTGLITLDNLEKIIRKNSQHKFVKYWNLQFWLNKDNDLHKEENNSNCEEIIQPIQPGKNATIGNVSNIKVDKKREYLLKENPVEKSLSYRVAECCNPIPGDAVIGFIDDDNHVVVHKKTCPEAIQLAATHGDRIINAQWTKHTILSFLARVELKGIDRMGIINDITKYITCVLNVNIRKIHFETHDGVFDGYIDLYVHNTEDLELMIKRIQKINGVDNVIRMEINE